MPDGVDGDLIAGARAYEVLHVPALFQEWVEPVLDAAEVDAGQAVLDIACGTGVLARGARRRVGSRGSVIGVDPDPGMLAVAEEIDASVEWREGVAESLPVPDESIDVVVSQFGMMFFTDRSKAVGEMLRVLRDGGNMAVAVWDSLAHQAAYAIEVKLLDELAGVAAADALRAPFALGNSDELRAELERAGVQGVRVRTQVGTARFPSVRALVTADLRGWLPIMGVRLSEEVIEEVLRAAERDMAKLVAPGGEVVFDSPAHIASGHKS